ncbi:class I mannose-6-phosphate isomerase [Sphingomonas sp. H160509]|uniref:class I mannose-6-phosphate isomerase n=1 Tax=Sphingomonas sp. H160509 TaxID=2955313 RepID=UPI0020975BF2|nr:class I mannose-6-phosphate isomerase [Sphingomonas sp. H160509]MDD1451603.1 class I mannose-6-phosphate isomerase [Sphingomonas sp. H160509]
MPPPVRRRSAKSGSRSPATPPPDLLIKYLFTSEKLSVQVHPNDEQAHSRGLPRGKDECWTVLAAEPTSTIAVGTKQPISKDELRQSAIDGTIEDKLDWKPVKSGDFMYCASDTIHAIGGGLTVIEVQQNSETTYRLYDYGSDRELHLKDGIEVADPTPYVPVAPPIEVETGRTIMVEGPKFVLERWKGRRPRRQPARRHDRLGDPDHRIGRCRWRRVQGR